jgi:predicted metal-dependent hydrolase
VEAGSLSPALRRGVRLFNIGRYFSAQQVFEDAWRAAEEPVERAFLEALVQLAGGLHLRTRRGATRGAVHLVSQALVALEGCRPAHFGVDVDALIEEFHAYVEWMKQTDRPHRMLDRLTIPRLRTA